MLLCMPDRHGSNELIAHENCWEAFGSSTTSSQLDGVAPFIVADKSMAKICPTEPFP